MGFLSKLFGRKPARPQVAGRGISLYQMSLQQQGVSSKKCGVCGKSFACPSQGHTIMTANIDGFVLDVGGYCPKCKAFRCHDHVAFKSDTPMIYEVHCKVCGSAVKGVS